MKDDQLAAEAASPRAAWGLVALFVGSWVVGAITAQGFLEDDAWAHYLYARATFSHPAYLVDVWGRPVCTGLYAIAAPWAGMFGCQVISLLLVLLAAELTRRVAKELRIDQPASLAFLLAGPVLYLHSLSVMTELPFAVLLIAAFLAYLRRNRPALAILVGLLPLARPEGFGFVLLAAIYLLMSRRWFSVVLLALPLVAWSWLGWMLSRNPTDRSPWLWLIDHWPYSADSTYGRGWLVQFVVLLPLLVGVGMPFVILGVRRAMRTRYPFVLLALVPLAMLAVHSLLWWLGKMASYGEIRYLLIVAPFWALLAALGWQHCRVKPSPALLTAISLVAMTAVKATVLRSSPEGRVAADVAAWVGDRRVVASHPAVNAYLDRGTWEPWSLRRPEADLVLIWDPKTGPANADARLAVDMPNLEVLGWEIVQRFHRGWVAMRARRSTDHTPGQRPGSAGALPRRGETPTPSATEPALEPPTTRPSP